MSTLYVTSEITLNLSRPNSGVVVYAKQYDKDSRVIDINLINGSSVWDPPANTEIVVLYVKPDGNKGIYDVVENYPRYSAESTYKVGDRVLNGSPAHVWRCTSEIATPEAWSSSHWHDEGATTPAVQKLSEGKIRLTLAEQALTCAGNTFVEISFFTEALRSTTLSFILAVETGVSDDTDLISSEYFNVLSELIQGLLGATTNPPQIDPVSKNWMLWNENTAQYEDSGYSSVGLQGIQGEQGWSIVSVTKTGGTGAGGTIDTYTMRNNNPNASQQVVGTFNVYNGNDGEGAPGSATPLIDSGIGVRGNANAYSREDHQHPLNVPSSGTPANLGDPSNGTASTYARSDHVHSAWALLDLVYPVGSIYMSVNDTDPGTLFGGIWSPLEDVFLLGASSNYIAGTMGGEETHTLSESEMPSHRHAIRIRGFNATTSNEAITNQAYSYTAQATNAGEGWAIVKNTGGGNAHNNMPPYLAVYMWKRTG